MKNRISTLFVAIGLVFLWSSVIFAEEGKKNLEFSGWVDRIAFSGDLRLRHDSAIKDPAPDRHRQRFRLRFGSEIMINDFTVGIRLASGTGEQVSTNQSFDSLFGQKAFWIDRTYLQWKGLPWLTLAGGRMPNPFFTIYTTDLVWDDDLNPEGFAENFIYRPADALTLFLNLGQFVLDEDKEDNNDQWLFGQQAGVESKFTSDVKLKLAASYYDATNTKKSDFGQNVVQSGNSRIGGGTGPNKNVLLNDFNVLDLTIELATAIGRLPLSLQGDYIKNLANTTTGEETGYQAGARLGKASDPHTWEAAYFYKLVETDATLADLNDSDFGDGGTNRKGHNLWVAYNLSKPLQFKVRYITTKVENEALAPNKDDIDRLFVDLAMKF